MKKIYVLLFCIGFTFGIQAQEFNFIPSSPEIKQLANGWYKYSFEGTNFDVEILAGKLSQGNINWFDGSSYSGGLSGNAFAGKGTYTWPDGSKYEGAFKKNQRSGKGSFTNVDGTKWSGKWKDNLRNGKGKIFDKDGNILKEGLWKSDKLVEKK